MKKLIIILLCIISMPVFSYQQEKPSKTQKEIKAKLNSIEMFDDIPTGRKFKKLTPVYGQCTLSTSLKCAMKVAKKQALEAGADAIIEVKVSTRRQTAGSYATGFAYYGEDELPVVHGWAIKWIK